MEFLKERVYTALNAYELKVGSKVVIAKNISALKDFVYNNMISTLTEIYSENNQDRFHGEYIHKCGYGYDTVTGTLCYLIREPEEKTDRPFKNIDELIKTWKKINPVQQPLYTKPLIWIENRFTEEVELITTYDYANSFHSDDRVETSTRVLTMEDLYREYRILNGDICGVKDDR